MNNNILKITFDASTINGIISKDIRYTPSMSNSVLYNSFPNILFIPSIKLGKNLFDKDLGVEDIKKVFLSSFQFNNFLTRLKEKKMYKPISINQAKTKGIIYNNIKFILELFFKKGDKLNINTKPYIINNYKWNNKYNIVPVSDKKNPMVEIKLTFVLHDGKELSFIDSTKLNCMQKKQDIVNDYYSLIGLKHPSEKTALNKYIPINTNTQSISSKYNRYNNKNNTIGRKKYTKNKTRKRFNNNYNNYKNNILI